MIAIADNNRIFAPHGAEIRGAGFVLSITPPIISKFTELSILNSVNLRIIFGGMVLLVPRLKELCNEKGVSFIQFERESGVGVNSAGRWDINSPSLKKVILAAHYFGLTVSELIGETNPASISTDGITEGINSLTPEFREVFVRFLASAKEQPEKAVRYLSFAVQELESH